MDPFISNKIENERWSVESAIRDVQEDFKDIDNGGNITTTRFRTDLDTLVVALQDLKNKLFSFEGSK